jgi:hypothetical protein
MEVFWMRSLGVAIAAFTLVLGGCDSGPLAGLRLTEPPEEVAQKRVEFILTSLLADNKDPAFNYQGAICKWYKNKIYLSDRDEQEAALDGFQAWWYHGGGPASDTIRKYSVEKVDPAKAKDPPDTFYITVKIDGVRRKMRVPAEAPISWS